MIITVIFFRDKDCSHVKIVDSYNGPSHILINGEIVQPSGNGSWNPDDFIVDGGIKEIKAAIKRETISHYMNRETEETMSYATYHECIKSFKKENGEYKDLESEYLCRKMEQTYIPIKRTYYEYEDVAFTYKEADLQPDEYCICNGTVKKEEKVDEHKKYKYTYLFVFKFNKWKFCNDCVKRLMEEYGIQRVEKEDEAASNEYYILHDKTGEYKWLEFCGDEYFLNYSDQFGKDRTDKPNYIYGTYDECLEVENAIEKKLRERIEYKLDKVRVITIKKSNIKEIYERMKALEKSACNNKKKTKKDIAQDIRMFLYKFAELTKVDKY